MKATGIDYTQRSSLHLLANEQTRQEVLYFHSLTNLVSARHLAGRVAYCETDQERLDPRDTELVLSSTDRHGIGLGAPQPDAGPQRRRTTRKFDPDACLRFDTVARLLRQAFGCTPATGGRPHPSAGRLYPVSVLLALLPSRITGAPPVTVYHLRPIAGLLEPLANPSEADLATVAMDRASAASDDPLAVEHPAFFLVYAVHLDKAVARYRHRGYRFALLEAGAMCQQAELVAADLELGACLWGGFGDNELAALLGINPAVLLPLVVHFMGRPAAAAASAAADRRAGPPAAPPAAGGS